MIYVLLSYSDVSIVIVSYSIGILFATYGEKVLRIIGMQTALFHLG